MDIHEAAGLKEIVHGLRRDGADAENRGKQIRPRPQMLDRAQKFDAVALFLQRIIAGGQALHRDGGRFELKRLLCFRGQDQYAFHDQRRAHVELCDLVVIGQRLPFKYDLHALEGAAVVELGKAEVLHIPHGADPAADRHRIIGEHLRAFPYLCDARSFHP